MTKIVYNACFGGFGLSEQAVLRYAELKGLKVYPAEEHPWSKTYWTVPPESRLKCPEPWHTATPEAQAAYNKQYAESVLQPREFARTDKILIQVIEELGAAASGEYARLEIAEVPSGSKYRIDAYDGSESVETPDSYEWETAP